VPRLARTPSREETIARYEQMSGRAVRNLRYNEVLAAVALGIPISRLETRLRTRAYSPAISTWPGSAPSESGSCWASGSRFPVRGR
jgi:hypothetical protein